MMSDINHVIDRLEQITKQRDDLLAACGAFIWLHDATDRRLCEDAGVEPSPNGCDCDLCLKAKAAMRPRKGE